MKNVYLIAAVGKSGQLGLGDRIPWNDPDDMKWFQTMTRDSILIMGHNTYKTTGERLEGTLGRKVVRWDAKLEVPPKAFLELILQLMPDMSIWIAGGAKTYKTFLPYVDRSYIGHVDYDGPADVYMPPLWRERQRYDPFPQLFGG